MLLQGDVFLWFHFSTSYIRPSLQHLFKTIKHLPRSTAYLVTVPGGSHHLFDFAYLVVNLTLGYLFGAVQFVAFQICKRNVTDNGISENSVEVI